MSVIEPAKLPWLTVFTRFSQTREFSWDSGTAFKTGPKLVSTDTFGLLVALTVDTCEASFLDVLSDMECVLDFWTLSARSLITS